MSSSQTTTTEKADLDAVVEALRSHDRFLVTTHENPDGDALGSLLAATLALRQLGKDVYMYLAGHAPLPGEYTFMPLEELKRSGADVPKEIIKKRRGRKFMNEEDRREVSERMKRYWASRREQKREEQ